MLLKLHRRRSVALTSGDGQASQPFDQIEQLVATLIAQYLANEATEHVHVVAKRRVLGREIDFGAIHGREFTPDKSKGRATRVARPLTGRSPA